MNPSIQECVFVLESPSGDDLLDGRREGAALSSALELSRVPTQYFHIANKRSLKAALARIAKHPKSMNRFSGGGSLLESRLYVPILHFSFHANDTGLALSSDEFLPWTEFVTMLREFNDAYGWNLPGKSTVSVSLSACSGFSLCGNIPASEPVPFAWLVGFPSPIAWSDALVAFVSYYHLLIQKGFKGDDAVNAANSAAGLAPNTLKAMNRDRKFTSNP